MCPQVTLEVCGWDSWLRLCALPHTVHLRAWSQPVQHSPQEPLGVDPARLSEAKAQQVASMHCLIGVGGVAGGGVHRASGNVHGNQPWCWSLQQGEYMGDL